MKKYFLMMMGMLTLIVMSNIFVSCGDDDDDSPENVAPQTPNDGDKEKPKTIDGFEFVDLGLSVKWAVCNVGAKSELDAGDYFQYGNPNALAVKTNANDLPTYDIQSTNYDPATVNMSKKWHMPSYEDFYELTKKCTVKLITTEAGLRYVLVVGPNGNSMKIPMAGAYPYDEKKLSYDNYQAWLLTSTLDNNGNPRPYAFKIIYTNESREPEMVMNTNELIRLSRVNIRAISTAAADGEEKSSDESLSGTGTREKPYNVAAAIAKCKEVGEKGTSYVVYVKGVVTAIKSINTTYGYATFSISDDNKGTNEITAYNSWGMGYKAITDPASLKIGDYVVVCGNLIDYQNSDPRFDSFCHIYSINGVSDDETLSGEAKGNGTLNNPFNAVAAINYARSVGNAESEKNVYIKGKVSTIVQNYERGYAQFYISEDGATINEFQCYRSLYLENQLYKSGKKLKVGDEVIVFGKVLLYRGNTPETKEFKAYLYSLNGVARPANNLTCPDSNHPHLIDLGLPSGTRWACCNIGATIPEGYGGYFAWGEINEKSVYTWATYQYGSSEDDVVNIGSNISGLKNYDAAYVNWGYPWYMPTKAQFQELINNTTSEWTQLNGVIGRLFVGNNGGFIFLPAAGHRMGDAITDVGILGGYWSSTLNMEMQSRAYELYFRSTFANESNYYRYCGQSIRPVLRNW